MSCCNNKHPHHPHHPNKFIDVTCAKPKPRDEVPALLGLNECGNIVPTEKPEHELSEEDRDKLDGMVTDGDGKQALFNDGTYKKVYTKEQSDAITAGLEERMAQNTEAIADNAGAIDDLRSEVADNYLALAGNSEQTSITGDVYTAARIVARQSSPEGTQYRVMVDGTEAGYERFGSSLAQTDFRSSGRPTVNSSHEIAYVSEVEAVQEEVYISVANLTEAIHTVQDNLDSAVEDLTDTIQGVQQNVEGVASDLSTLGTRVDAAEANIEENTTSLTDLRTATESAFNTVHASLDSLDGRVTTNEADIALHTSDIEALRDDLASRELFRGYYETTGEITAIENPAEGNYAWNAETGTVWLYNGTTWADSAIKIPDQTVEAYDALPRMDGQGDAGATNRYARGDHQHPSDESKADLTELDNYLSLEGNTQTSRMTGDLWMATGQMVRLTNSGNSGLRQNADENTTELVSNGVGGIHLVAPNGTVKYNGEEIAIKSELENATTDISELQSVVDTHTGNIATLQSDVENNADGIAALQSAVSKNTGDILVLHSDIKDNSTEINEVATVVSQHVMEIQNNASDIAAHTSDIASIREELASQEHFRGYLATTAEITAIQDPRTGDYAYNAETGTRWAYNGTTWYDTRDLIPDQTVEAYDGLPLIDGEASKGLANQYARGDHRHPTDTSRASAAELATTNLALSGLQNEVSGYQSANDADISALQTDVAVNEAQISGLTDRVSTQETTIYTLTGDVATHTAEIANLTSRVDSGKTHIGTLRTQTVQLGKDLDKLSVEVADIDSRVLTNKNDIATLQSQYNEQEHFRGFYLSTVEVTSLKAKAGDYAWNSETGTVWVYDIEIPSWTDSGVAIPVQAVFAAAALPLQDGVASAGESSDYARGDHRHPTDDTRAGVRELAESNNRIAVLETSTDDQEIRISGLEEDSSTHNSDISALQISVSDQEEL